MAYNIPLSIQELFFAAMETTFGTAVAPTNSNACRVSSGNKFTPVIATLTRPEKTNTRAQTVGSRGRVAANWEVHTTLCGNGAPGVAPDNDPLNQLAFGHAPTIAASTSVTYNLYDTILSASLWDYRNPSTVEQRGVVSAVATRTVYEFGGDYGLMTSTGEAISVIDNNYFSSIPSNSSGEKGGLSAFPTVPASPVTNGTPAIGFTGSFTDATDSTVIAEVLSGSITINTGNAVKRNQFGTYTGTSTYGTRRQVTLSFITDDSDSTGLYLLKKYSKLKTPVNVTLVVGTIAGNIHTFTMKNLLLNPPDITDPDPTYQANFGESPAFASSLTSYDDLVYSIT